MLKQEVHRAYNFNAGPAALPLSVLEKAREEILDFEGTGMSVMEMSHRSPAYDKIHNEAIALFKELMGLPQEYHVLFLQGGASTQFAMVPMNFLGNGQKAGYIVTGSWADKALKEAKLLGETYIVASTKETNHNRIPGVDELQIEKDSAYIHLTSNNTIHGTEWASFPDTGDIPLVADMSSDILSRPFDASKFSLIYAGAQKNLGPSGVTVVAVSPQMMERASVEKVPTMLRYDTHAKNNSLYNTPPSYGIYMLGLVLKWVKEMGGVEGIQAYNQKKTALIYNAIDESNGFYIGHAEKEARSLMNITYNLQTPELEKQFLAEAKAAGFVGLNGHRSVGGCRASTYNAVPMENCEALRNFMIDFQKKNG